MRMPWAAVLAGVIASLSGLVLGPAGAQAVPTPDLTDSLANVDSIAACQDEIGGPGFLRLTKSSSPVAPATVTVLVDINDDTVIDETRTLGGAGNPTSLTYLRPTFDVIRVHGEGFVGEVLVDFEPCGAVTTTTSSTSTTTASTTSTTGATTTSVVSSVHGVTTSTTKPAAGLPTTGSGSADVAAIAALFIGVGLLALGRRERELGC
jgi:hypothetical protein